MATDASVLADVPMFSLLDADERSTLSELLDDAHFSKGDTIFSFGDSGESLFLVRSGRVQVYVENFQGDKIPLAENEAGDVFGEISLLDGGPRTATAVAVEDSECLTLDRAGLLEFVTLHPHAALDLLTVMGRRLRATDEMLRTHVTRNLNQEEDERLTFGERI
ncbi:MAG TPA: cyclic nucleotide-binding domain-containing protein, partial [Terriglobales bacterium]|nr:cyclic nucleotide-binding domain-containing protein [Terriglobales bacterium]